MPVWVHEKASGNGREGHTLQESHQPNSSIFSCWCGSLFWYSCPPIRLTHTLSGTADVPKAREALKLLLSPEGQFFREFITNEVVLSIDAMSRAQLAALVARLGLAGVNLPVLFPGATRQW